MNDFDAALDLMKRQLTGDMVMSLATSWEDVPSVRNVDAFYKDGCLYVTSHGASHKMGQIEKNAKVAFCRGFSLDRPFYEGLLEGFGVGENLGHPCDEKNTALREELKEVFSDFYDRHVDEGDPQTCILRVRITQVVVFDGAYKFAVDFEKGEARRTDCPIA